MLITKIIAIIQKLLSWIFWPYFYLRSLKTTKKLPPIESKYLQMSAVEIAGKIRQREISSREIVEVFIERIKTVNTLLNAVVEDRFQDALDEADKADAYIRLESKNIDMLEKTKPLFGVPFTVKESCKLKGMPLSVGCAPLKGKIADADGEAVKNLRDAGAIPLVVTNTPELCLCWECNNLVTGCTRNPYNLHRTCGGSSGGEGALIGAGASPFGIGSDLGGSIRIPSMFNGIFGHKTSPGIISTEGHFPAITNPNFNKHMAIGPMSRYSADLPLLLKVMAGERAHLLNLDEQISLNKINIYYVEEATDAWYSVRVEEEIKSRMKEAVQYLKTAYGCHTQKGPFEELTESGDIASAVILGIEGMPNLLDFSKKERKNKCHYFEIIKATLGISEFSTFGTFFNTVLQEKIFNKKMYDIYYQKNEELKAKFKEVLKDNGVLLYPTFPIPAFYHNEIFTNTVASMYTMVVNALLLPATHVPLGLNKNGLPIGLQVIAGPNQDRLCLEVARALEERFGGWVPPPSNE